MSRSPIHPDDILADELKELGLAPTELARQQPVLIVGKPFNAARRLSPRKINPTSVSPVFGS